MVSSTLYNSYIVDIRISVQNDKGAPVEEAAYWAMAVPDLQPASVPNKASRKFCRCLKAQRKENLSSLFPSSLRNGVLTKYKVTGKKQIYVSILLFVVLFLEDLVNACLS